MASYEAPVAHLVALGRHDAEDWTDYSTLGIGPESVPDLVRLVQDQDLAHAGADSPEEYARIHAWRALGQLRSEAAIEPLLDLLATQEDEDEWSDWLTEEVPRVLGMIGPAAFDPAATRLEQTRTLQHAPVYYAETLAEVARHHPEMRAAAVNRLSSFLSNGASTDPSVNAFIISDLIDLNAVEAWPVIEAAFALGNVDEFVTGDAAQVKWHLGLGPKPSQAYGRGHTIGPRTDRNPKARAQARAKKRKAEKRRMRKRR